MQIASSITASRPLPQSLYKYPAPSGNAPPPLRYHVKNIASSSRPEIYSAGYARSTPHRTAHLPHCNAPAYPQPLYKPQKYAIHAQRHSYASHRSSCSPRQIVLSATPGGRQARQPPQEHPPPYHYIPIQSPPYQPQPTSTRQRPEPALVPAASFRLRDHTGHQP